MYIRRWVDAACVCGAHGSVCGAHGSDACIYYECTYVGRQIGVSAHVQMYSGDQLLQ